MIGVFYLPYQDMELNNNTTPQIDAKKYLGFLVADENKYGRQVYNMVYYKFAENMSDNDYEKWKRKYKSQKTGYIPCRCNILSKSGKSLTESELSQIASTPGSQNIMIIQLDKTEYELDDILNKELEMWMMRTNKIQNIPLHRFDKDESKAKVKQLKSFPVKTFRLQTQGGNFVVLEDVRFIQNKGTVSSFAILVGNTTYISQEQIKELTKKQSR